MQIDFIETVGQWVSVGVDTDDMSDEGADAACEFASEALGFDHGHHESTQAQDYGYVVRFELH